MAASEKMCTVCGKDVSQMARVKDARGLYYCQKCHDARKVAKAPAAAAQGDGDLDFAPMAAEPVKRPRTPSVLVQAVPQPVGTGPAKANVAAGDPPKGAERVANATAGLMKWGFYLAIVAFLIFSAYGLYLMFGAPKGAFDDYPTTHEKLIKDFMTDISQGTDKAYEKAFLLISFRARLTNNPDEIQQYKLQFAKIHDAMVAKHGASWINTLEVSRDAGVDIGDADDATLHTIKIGGASYHVVTQVQIAVDQMVVNLPGNMRDRKVYPEDGKNHFGVIEMEEFPVDWRHKPGGGGGGGPMPGGGRGGGPGPGDGPGMDDGN